MWLSFYILLLKVAKNVPLLKTFYDRKGKLKTPDKTEI